MEKKIEDALHWIVSILQKHNVPFKVSGGLAAQLYGSKRPLYDIDIELPDCSLSTIIPEVKEHIVFGPTRYRDSEWDLLLLTLNYKGQPIDLSGWNTLRVFNKRTGHWNRENPSPRVTYKSIAGLTIPTEPKEELIAYKKKIARETDLDDIRQLS